MNLVLHTENVMCALTLAPFVGVIFALSQLMFDYISELLAHAHMCVLSLKIKTKYLSR